MLIPFVKVANHQTFTDEYGVEYRKLSPTFASHPRHHQSVNNTLPSDLIIFQPDERVHVNAK